MGDVDFLSKTCRFSKCNIFDIWFYFLHHPFDALKPNHFHFIFAIREIADQSFFVFRAGDFEVGELAFDLHVRHQLINFLYGIKFGSILIAKWIMLNEVTKRKNFQFFLKEGSALRSNAF